jgi:hypothetical protein
LVGGKMKYKIPDYLETEKIAYMNSIKRLCELMAVDENIDTEILYLNVLRDIKEIKDIRIINMSSKEVWTEIARIIKNNIKLATVMTWETELETILNDLE